jgi:protein-S-isoprenylcysteine O-methyltransferase Ste14
VILQFLLLGAIAAVGIAGGRWPTWAGPWRIALAVVVALGGVLLALVGARHLGEALTPFPRPRRDAPLREEGVYALVRHPIYGGVLLLSVAWSLLTSPWASVPAALLAALFVAKSRREEAWLAEHYPEYPAYAARVRRRFLPYVW